MTPTDYSIGTFETVNEYKQMDLKSVTDEALVNSLADSVLSSSAPKEIRTKAQDVIPGDEALPLKDLKVKAYKFDGTNVHGYIVCYENNDEQIYGPRFVVFDHAVSPLTGWRSYPYLRAFRLNGIIYIDTGSGCCNCGITIMELYKIEQKNVELIYSDGSESD